jgi:uncharacterized protein (TIRG00374 family)
MPRKHLWLLVKSVVGLALISLLLHQMNWAEVGTVLRRMSFPYFLGLMAVAFMLLSASCWKWRLLLSSQRMDFSWRYLFEAYFIGYFFTNLLPSNVGGDVYRAWRVGRDSGHKAAAVMSVFFERFTGLIVLVALVLAAPAVKPGVLENRPIMLVFVTAIGYAAVIALVLTRMGWLRRLLGGLIPFRSVTETLERVAGYFGRFRLDPGTLARVMAASVLFYLLTFLNVWFGFMTFRLHVPLRDILVYTPVIIYVSMIPVSINSLGLVEGAYVYCFLLAGVPKEASLSVALLMRLKLILFGLIGGAIYVYSSRHSRDHQGRP